MTTVLVCGGRDYNNKDTLFSTLDSLHAEYRFTRLVHGNAKGADSLADEWAFGKVETIIHTADWDKYGKAAGPIRNQAMMDEKPDLVVAFPGGRGTADMVGRAMKAGVTVIRVKG